MPNQVVQKRLFYCELGRGVEPPTVPKQDPNLFPVGERFGSFHFAVREQGGISEILGILVGHEGFASPEAVMSRQQFRKSVFR